MDQLVCFWGASASVYNGAKGEGGAGQEEGAGGVLLLPGVGLPPNPIPSRIPQGGKEGEGWPATSPSPNRTRGGGGAQPPWAAPFSFPLKPIKAHMAPGGFR